MDVDFKAVVRTFYVLFAESPRLLPDSSDTVKTGKRTYIDDLDSGIKNKVSYSFKT